MSSFEIAPFSFIVDTDSYAGNFERELCAFMTGVVGDCEVGSEIAEEVEVPFNMENLLMKVPDEHGCCRPCTIVETPEIGKHQSVEIFFEEEPSKELLEFLKERANLVSGIPGMLGKWIKPFKVTGFRTVKRTLTEIYEPF